MWQFWDLNKGPLDSDVGSQPQKCLVGRKLAAESNESRFKIQSQIFKEGYNIDHFHSMDFSIHLLKLIFLFANIENLKHSKNQGKLQMLLNRTISIYTVMSLIFIQILQPNSSKHYLLKFVWITYWSAV